MFLQPVGSAAGESPISKPDLGKRLYVFTPFLHNRLSEEPLPCIGLRAAASLAGLGNGAAQREEAGQEEEPAIKIKSQRPWIWCTKTFSLVLKTSCSSAGSFVDPFQTLRLNKLNKLSDLFRQRSALVAPPLHFHCLCYTIL